MSQLTVLNIEILIPLGWFSGDLDWSNRFKVEHISAASNFFFLGHFSCFFADQRSLAIYGLDKVQFFEDRILRDGDGKTASYAMYNIYLGAEANKQTG